MDRYKHPYISLSGEICTVPIDMNEEDAAELYDLLMSLFDDSGARAYVVGRNDEETEEK